MVHKINIFEIAMQHYLYLFCSEIFFIGLIELVCEVFIDSINLHNGFESIYLELSNYSNELNALQTNNMIWNWMTKTEMKLKIYYSQDLMALSIETLLNKYKAKIGLNLSMFYGILRVNKNHYVTVFIDINKCSTIVTCDSL